MRVSRLDKNGDWTFGNGRASYATGSEAIRQNVITRIKSFKNDWFLDISSNIDWFNILGNRNNKKIIESEVRRVTLETEGVLTFDKMEIVENSKRNAIITIEFTTIFDKEIKAEIGITE
jgi:hypothetical protein